MPSDKFEYIKIWAATKLDDKVDVPDKYSNERSIVNYSKQRNSLTYTLPALENLRHQIKKKLKKNRHDVFLQNLRDQLFASKKLIECCNLTRSGQVWADDCSISEKLSKQSIEIEKAQQLTHLSAAERRRLHALNIMNRFTRNGVLLFQALTDQSQSSPRFFDDCNFFVHNRDNKTLAQICHEQDYNEIVEHGLKTEEMRNCSEKNSEVTTSRSRKKKSKSSQRRHACVRQDDSKNKRIIAKIDELIGALQPSNKFKDITIEKEDLLPLAKNLKQCRDAMVKHDTAAIATCLTTEPREKFLFFLFREYAVLDVDAPQKSKLLDAFLKLIEVNIRLAGESLLDLVIKTKDVPTIKKVLQKFKEHNLSINDTADGSLTSLQKAVWNGNRETVNLLLENGADINQISCNPAIPGTALIFSLQKKDEILTKFLLQRGADPNIPAITKTNTIVPLVLAFEQQCSADVIKTLIDNGAQVNNEFFCRTLTPMHYALAELNFEKTKFLLANGASLYNCGSSPKKPIDLLKGLPDTQTKKVLENLIENSKKKYDEVAFENFPKSFAIKCINHLFTQPEAAKLIEDMLQTEVNVSKLLCDHPFEKLSDEQKNLVLIFSRYALDKNAFYTVLDHGIDPTIQTLGENLIGLFREDDDLAYLHFLLNNYSFDLSQTNNDGMTPLIMLINNNSHLCLVDELLKHDANPNQCYTDRMFTIPALAVCFNSPQSSNLVNVLLNYNADPNGVVRDETTKVPLLTYALYTNFGKECFQLLIDKGARINSCDSQGCTALHKAAFLGKKDLIKILLSAGADATRKNKQGQFAYEWAEDENIKELLFNAYLEQQKATVH